MGGKLGYSHILAFDRIQSATPNRPGGRDSIYSCLDAFLRLITLFTFMADKIERTEFNIGSLVLPQQRAALPTKQIAAWDSMDFSFEAPQIHLETVRLSAIQ